MREAEIHPDCCPLTCNTQRGTPTWNRHVNDLEQLLDQAQGFGNPELIAALSALVDAHKHKCEHDE
jgi:hypothetical protein